MKKIVLFLSVALFSAAAFAQPTVPAAPKEGNVAAVAKAKKGKTAKMTFITPADLNLDYGTIEKDSEPFREFIFKNTGKAPLIISNAVGSCGCTVPTYPKEPILPGKKAAIKVRYATDRVGAFTKNITLTTNVPGEESIKLTIHGNVLAGKTDATTPVKDDVKH